MKPPKKQSPPSPEQDRSEAKPYRVLKRADGVTCLYLPTFNTTIAEFYDSARVDAEIVGKILEGAAETKRQLQELRTMLAQYFEAKDTYAKTDRSRDMERAEMYEDQLRKLAAAGKDSE